MPIVALVDMGDRELAFYYRNNGRFTDSGQKYCADLMMVDGNKFVRWVNIYYSEADKQYVIDRAKYTEREARECIDESAYGKYEATIKLEWEK